MIDWYSEAKACKDEWIEIRRDFHQHPELGNHEFHTKEKIITYLKSLSIETHEILQTGVLGVLHCDHPGKTVMFRSDMDALPIREENDYHFCSVNEGVMHACGHDMHMTCLLGAAKLLAQHRHELKGTMMFLFQPDEEGDGGADRMIQQGVLEHVDAVFGCHCDPELPAGSIGIRYGMFYASSAVFEITITGISSHGAQPEKGKDALLAAAQFVVQSKQLEDHTEDSRTIVHTGILNAGTANNIVADHAYIKGMMRTESLPLRQQKIEALQKLIARIEEETGTKFHAKISKGYPGVTNHDQETAYVEMQVRSLLGYEKVCLLDQMTMTTEDFGYYLLHKPGCFYHLGTASPYPLHHPRFQPDENALVEGIALHAKVLSEYC